MERISGIYRIVHIESGRAYIGRTVHWVKRQRAHVWHLERGKHQSTKLQRAWDKHGAAAFRFEFLEAVSREELVTREQAYLDELAPFYNAALNAANPILGPVKTHCPAGHPYEGKNRRVTRDGGVKCRTCNAEKQHARWLRKQKAEGRTVGLHPRDRTHCPRGHSYADHAGVSPSGWRYCKRCRREQKKAEYDARAAAEGRIIGPKPGTQTHCLHGHEFTPDNTYLTKPGWRACRQCKRDRREAEREAKKAAGTYRPRPGWPPQERKKTHD